MESGNIEIKEGYMPFISYKTYYRIVSPKNQNIIVNNIPHKKKPPLILLHGGPGSTHDSLEVLDKISYLDNRQLIYYDQLGCGKSSIEEGHPELWVLKTWVEELKTLINYLNLTEYHLLGLSWGGMLEMALVSDENPKGVKSVILSSALSSSKLWGEEQHIKLRYLSNEDQIAIYNAEKTGNYNSYEYRIANQHFLERHCNYKIDENSPECLKRPCIFGEESYNVAWGPNEFTPLGTLKNFDYTEKLKNWNVPCLITSGTEDMCTPFIAKTMFDAIPGAKWELFQDCKHCGFVDQNEKFCKVVIDWLNKHDN